MVGIDEVGRGCWAGPLLVVAARQTGDLPPGLADSKLLTRQRRQALLAAIQCNCQLGEGWVTATEIDHYGLTTAMKLGVNRALAAIRVEAEEEIILDGKVNYCPPHFKHVQTVVDADALYPLVSAASIYAKETRDHYMSHLSKQYANYHFERHVGYGTKLHRDMLRLYGVCDLHRVSFKPITAFLTVSGQEPVI